jgi:hypothetical protein
MSNEVLIAIAKAIESFNARLNLLEQESAYGKMLIEKALSSNHGNPKKGTLDKRRRNV